MKIINTQETSYITYDLNNANEKKYHDEFKEYRDCVKNFKAGRMTFDNALFVLQDALEKYEKKLDEIPDWKPLNKTEVNSNERIAKINDSEMFNVMYNATRANQIRELIEELEAVKVDKLAQKQGGDDVEGNTPENIPFLKHLADHQELGERQKNGKYNLRKTTKDFVFWYVLENYINYNTFANLPDAMDKYLNHGCSIETLKRYVRDAKADERYIRKNRKILSNLKEN